MTTQLNSSPPALEREFTLQGGDGKYQRIVSAQWENSDDRIFGGYTAALSFAAAARESPDRSFCSGHVIFLEGVHRGQIDFDVTPMRVGRSVAAMRIDGMQDGRRVLATQVWLRHAPTLAAPPGVLLDEHRPLHAVELSWLSRTYKFHQWLESRGIDYPSSIEDFAADPKHSVDVWLRPKDPHLSPGTATQLFDILVADAHISDCQLRAEPRNPASLVSLDLAIQWTSVVHRTGWRRMQAFSPPASDGSAACVATICDETGTVCATATQQTWIMKTRMPVSERQS